MPSTNRLTHLRARSSQAWAKIEARLFPGLAPAKTRKHKLAWYLLTFLLLLAAFYAWKFGFVFSLIFIDLDQAPETQELLDGILAGSLDKTTPIPGFAQIVVGLTITNIALTLLYSLSYFLLRKQTHFSLRGRLGNWKQFFVGLGLSVLLCHALVLPLEHFAPQESENQQLIELLLLNSPLWLGVLSLSILGPIVEELLFRQFFVGYFCNGSWIGVFLSALVFAWVHEPQVSLNLMVYLVLGLILGAVFRLSQSFALTCAVHMLYNFTAIIMI